MLYTFSTHITSDGRIITLTGYFINFINEYNALFCFGNIIICHLQQASQNTFNILTYVSCLGKHRGIHNRKRNMKQFGNSTRQQGLSRTSTSYHNNVGLFNFHIITAVLLQQALIVIVYRHGKETLGIVLSNDILIKEFFYF